MSAPDGPRLLVLDSASLYYRAFFGLPDTLKAPDGTVINALRGLLDFITTLSHTYEPEVVVAAWDDAWRPTWRVDLLASYKTHRLAAEGEGEDTPPLLSPQVTLIRKALDALGIPIAGAADFEADDVIASVVELWNGPVDVVTGDRDLFQLVDDDAGVRVLYTARGVGKHDVVDADWIRTKYAIEPQQYVDFAVMRGDTSDGIPGVAGIGEKTAAALLAEFGTLDAIRAAAADDTTSLKPRVRANLLDATAYLDVAPRVVTTRRDALAEAPFSPTVLDEKHQRTFEKLAEELGLGGVAERIIAALS